MEHQVDTPAAPVALDVPPPIAPVPMSFPALLVNPKSRVAQLRTGNEVKTPMKTVEIAGKGQGKRWIRRAENSAFGGNPHIVKPTKGDYDLTPVQLQATFPRPLPPYLPRVSSAPSPVKEIDVPSSRAGRFSLSLKGIRKELRQRGRRANELVKDVEDAMKAWLDGTTTTAAEQVPRPVDRGEHPSVMELSHNSLQLKWKTNDPFARYIIHCVARWYSVVSFSKDVPTTSGTSERHTFLLRPNTRYPDPRAVALLHTPTSTDVDSPSFETDSEIGDLASSTGSLHIAPNPAAPSGARATVGAIEGEQELSDHEGYSSESSFAIIDKDGEVQDSGVPKKDAAPPRPLRTLERPAFAPAPGFTPTHLRSGSSPSRSPVRQRHPRPTRRCMTGPFSTLPTFRPPKEPTTPIWDFIFA